MTIATDLGTLIGQELLADRDAQGAPRSAAAELVGALLEVNPRAKLPALLVKDRIRRWMNEAGVTETMLREELARERKAMRHAKPQPDLKLPPKQRRTDRRNAPQPAQPSRALPPPQSQARAEPLAGLFDDGIVPN